MPDILLSGFADEAAPEKTIDQQFSAMAALGLQYLSIRFVDIGTGNGVQNVLEFSPAELQLIRKQLDHYGLNIASIGSPIGKVKITDVIKFRIKKIILFFYNRFFYHNRN